MFDLSELPPLSEPDEADDASRTFADIIDDVGDLPDRESTEQLQWAINEVVFSGEDGIQFDDAWITTRPVRRPEIDDTVHRHTGPMHQLHCEITGTAFYLPAGALVPVIAFRTSGDNGAEEPWSMRIHPGLVADGPEAVMKALVSSYLRNKLFDAGAELMWALQQLNLLRDMETLGGGWPEFGAPDDPAGYEVDEGGTGSGLVGAADGDTRAGY